MKVLQGEREMAADNKMLGQFDLVGIPPAPRGVPQIEVTFDIDANGIVNVSARDKATGKEQVITIQSSGGLSENDIQQMVKDAEQYAQRDQERKQLIDARNEADSMVYSVEKSLNEHKDKLSQDVIDNVNAALSDLRNASASDNVNEIRQKTSATQTASMKIGEQLMQRSQSGGGSSGTTGSSGPSGPGSSGPGGVTDADYEEVKK